MARVALLSNPRSTGNQALLPRVRSFCAKHSDIFHYEVEHADQIGAALRTIARVKPKVLVINGGDGTVQAALTELYQGGHFGDSPPPVAVLPNGKTNLIAFDLGAGVDPMVALERVLEIARADMDAHIVQRELISLSGGTLAVRPVLGMFLGGAGLADSILYCRHRIYPLGLPNGLSHLLAVIAVFLSMMLNVRSAFLPPRPAPLNVSVVRHGQIKGRFAFLMVTTLEKLLLNVEVPGRDSSRGALQMLIIERRPMAMVRAVASAIRGRLGRDRTPGVHVERGDEIRIEGDNRVILDGETFEGSTERPIVLTHTAPVPFLRLAA